MIIFTQNIVARALGFHRRVKFNPLQFCLQSSFMPFLSFHSEFIRIVKSYLYQMYKQLQRMHALAADRLLGDISIHSAALAKAFGSLESSMFCISNPLFRQSNRKLSRHSTFNRAHCRLICILR